MEAVAVGNGQLGSRAALLQAASSFFTIGSGGSIGREGPLVQLAATVASKIGQWTQAPVPRLRLLVACGAAAGIADRLQRADRRRAVRRRGGARLNRDGELRSVDRGLGGGGCDQPAFPRLRPVYQVPHINFGAPWELALYALLGVLLGHGAPPYLALLDRARGCFAACTGSRRATLALGGLIVGVISVGVPQVWGNGYSVVNDMLNDKMPLDAAGARAGRQARSARPLRLVRAPTAAS